MLPPARVLDGLAPPDSGRAVEIEEQPRTVPATVLHHEVTVQNHGFRPGEEAVFGVDVPPSGLHHSDLGVGEMVDGLAQEGGLGHEVGVEDGHEFALGHLQSGFQGPGFIPLAVLSVEVVNVEAGLTKAFHALPGQKSGLVVGIVQNLDLQQVPGVVQPGHRFDQPFHHKQLVIDGKLDGYHRELGEFLLESRLSVPVSEVEVDQLVAVQPVNGQDSQYDKVGNQDGEIERVQTVLGADPVQKGSVGA